MPQVRRLSLTYSAPSDPSLSLDWPPPYFNPYPELNDADPDDHALSRFPTRAKFNLPLEGQFNPFADHLRASELDEEVAATLEPSLLRVLRLVFRDDPAAEMPIPRSKDATRNFELANDFELCHQRLSVSREKHKLRLNYIAPLYTAIEQEFATNQQPHSLAVPIAEDRRSKRPLPPIYADFTYHLERLRPIDEMASLLVTCMLAEGDDVATLERAWVKEEAQEFTRSEFRDFEDIYWKMRERFNPDQTDQRNDLAENAIRYIIDTWFGGVARRHSPRRQLPAQLAWPLSSPELDLPDVWSTIALPKRGMRPFGIAELIERGIANDLLRQHRKATFHYWDDTWPNYGGFEWSIDEFGSSIVARAGLWMAGAIEGTFVRADGSALAVEELAFARTYLLFVEALRQQLCTGVGLACPFWDGVNCCTKQAGASTWAGLFRRLLLRAWEVTYPRHPPWAHLWRAPPCL